ncbi:hypothetical protein Tco_0571192 [Tanacetum coccineum]
MITTSSRTGSKKPSGLILPPMERKDIMQISVQKQTTRPQESILKDKLAFIYFRISTLETTLKDIQVHQNLLQSENLNHQATILVVIEQVAARSDMDSKMAELLSFKHDVSDIDKRTKNKAKLDKTKHGFGKSREDKVNPDEEKVNPDEVKVNPEKLNEKNTTLRDQNC